MVSGGGRRAEYINNEMRNGIYEKYRHDNVVSSLNIFSIEKEQIVEKIEVNYEIKNFFALDEKAVRAIHTRPRSALFIGGYLLPRTKRVCTVPGGQLARQEGKSGYTFRKLLRHWRALVRCRFWRGPETPVAEIAWTTDADASVQAR